MKERDLLKVLSADWRTIFNMFFEGVNWIHLAQDRNQ
jgi:hypothetical protein